MAVVSQLDSTSHWIFFSTS